MLGVLALVGVVGFFLFRADDDDAGASTPSIAPVPATVDPPATVPRTGPDVSTPAFPDFTLPTLPELSIPDVQIPRPPGSFAPPGELPAATEAPEGLGDDPDLDLLAEACYEGAMAACDELYEASPLRSEYERYGDTCAGRQPEHTQQYCTFSFPE